MSSHFLLYSMRAPHFDADVSRVFFEQKPGSVALRALGEARLRQLVTEIVWPSQGEYIFEDLLGLDNRALPTTSATTRDEWWGLHNDAILERAITALHELIPTEGTNHEVARWTCGSDFGSPEYFVSGGMSSGDSPTDACDAIALLDELGVFDAPITAAEVTAVLRFG